MNKLEVDRHLHTACLYFVDFMNAPPQSDAEAELNQLMDVEDAGLFEVYGGVDKVPHSVAYWCWPMRRVRGYCGK